MQCFTFCEQKLNEFFPLQGVILFPRAQFGRKLRPLPPCRRPCLTIMMIIKLITMMLTVDHSATYASVLSWCSITFSGVIPVSSVRQEVTFFILFVCLFVSRVTQKNCSTEFHEIRWKDDLGGTFSGSNGMCCRKEL